VAHGVWAGLLLLALCPAIHAQPGFRDEMRKLFEWGEYDSLIDKLGPYLQTLPDSLDTIEKADYCEFLGVAYFARERVSDARECFTRAYHFNRRIALDQDFVSAAMYDFFQTTITEIKRQNENARRSDSLLRQKDRLITEKTVELHETAKTSASIRNTTAISLSLGFIAVLSGASSIYQYRVTDQLYPDFLSASSAGDLDRYRTLKSRIETGKVMIVTTAALAVLSSASAVVLVIRARGARHAQGEQTISIWCNPFGASIVAEF
jgi:hypothetical protein